MRNLAAGGLNIVACGSSEEAILSAEIVTTCTADKQYATILTDNMIGAGLHINAIGGDCPGKTELHRDILLRSDIFVEYPPQTRIEGEIQQLDPDHPGDRALACHHRAGAGTAGVSPDHLVRQRRLRDRGFSSLRYVRDQLARTGRFVALDLIADPDDPRDLYGMLLRAGKK